MLRQRIIFSLIYNRGYFTQSRNFRLQKVGDINWLEKNYRFQNISLSLDELVILDASKDGKNIKEFAGMVRRLVEDVFIPVAAGGGIKDVDDAKLLFNSGADKIVVNSLLYENPDSVKEISRVFGAQSIVASIDYRVLRGRREVSVNNGSKVIEIELNEYLAQVQSLGIGEIYLNSIDRDGTGFGYDLETIRGLIDSIQVPLIIAGGAGNGSHLAEGLAVRNVSGVATANLFNFIGDGLPKARAGLIKAGKNVAEWKNDF